MRTKQIEKAVYSVYKAVKDLQETTKGNPVRKGKSIKRHIPRIIKEASLKTGISEDTISMIYHGESSVKQHQLELFN